MGIRATSCRFVKLRNWRFPLTNLSLPALLVYLVPGNGAARHFRIGGLSLLCHPLDLGMHAASLGSEAVCIRD